MLVYILCPPSSCFSLFTVVTFLLSALNSMALPFSHGQYGHVWPGRVYGKVDLVTSVLCVTFILLKPSF